MVNMCVSENKEEKINWAQENCWEGGDTPCTMSSTFPIHFSGTEMLIF